MGLEELRHQQGGVVTYAQARAAGISAGRLRTDHVRVASGVYVPRHVHDAQDEAARTAGLVCAARLTSTVDLIAVGRTAAAIHGLPVLGRPPVRPQLVERKDLRPRHHGTSRAVDDGEVVTVHGAPVTDLARTAVDVARSRDLAHGVVTADAALARGVERAELERVLAACARWPGVTAARTAVAFADGRAESALESVSRVRFHEHGLLAPELQVVLHDSDGVIGRVDHYWAAFRVVGEADGALKYLRPEDLFAEKRREDRLRDAGWQVVRWTWDEALLRPAVVMGRVRRAFVRGGQQAA